MAKKLDPNINWYSEYTNGFHFMINYVLGRNGLV